MKIAVGLSGGVDSSVTAALLQAEGHEVVGITMKIWQDGKYRGGSRDACFGPGEADDIARADALCKSLGIPYHVFDCAEEYETVVLEYFRKEYLSGNTPNPCVRCNAFLKFGVLPRLARESGIAFDKFATGHYARIVERDGAHRLYRGADHTKDQSYFLYRLSGRQLSDLLFPLGNFNKEEVRALARRYDLAVKDKPDSQDFYSGDHVELLGVEDRQGNIVDVRGKVLGTHQGFWHYTVGQRKGLGIAAAQPLYVLEVNPCRNEVVVGVAEDTRNYELLLAHCHWIHEIPEGDVTVKIRSASQPAAATFFDNKLVFQESVNAPAKGQSAVVYRNDEVLGGGIIKEVLS